LKLIPVVILSSSGKASDIRKSYQLGANSYIQKPVEFERFVETVQTLSVYWLDLNKSARGGESV
jgi:two-component system response regulator